MGRETVRTAHRATTLTSGRSRVAVGAGQEQLILEWNQICTGGIDVTFSTAGIESRERAKLGNLIVFIDQGKPCVWSRLPTFRPALVCKNGIPLPEGAHEQGGDIMPDINRIPPGLDVRSHTGHIRCIPVASGYVDDLPDGVTHAWPFDHEIRGLLTIYITRQGSAA